MLVYMEFKITSTNTTPDVIYYNYKKATFYKNQYENRLDYGGYIKMPYASNQPNITSNILDTGYIANQLFIGKKIHKIENVDFDGELIIKHIPLTNNEKPLYTCFLLKTDKNMKTPTEIDDIIAGRKDNDLYLNYLIESSTAIHYDDCIIFTKPILVKTAFDGFEPVNIINSYNDNYEILAVEPNLGTDIVILKEGLANEMDTKAIAAYCSPIDEKDPSLGEQANTLLAIGGDESRLKNEATVSSINLSMNFLVFFALAVFATFAVPVMYYQLVVVMIIWNIYLKTPQEKLNRLYTVDIFLSIFMFGLAFSFMNQGIVSTDSYYTLLGFYIFIFFIASFIRIQYDRTFNVEQIYKDLNQEPEWNKIPQVNELVPMKKLDDKNKVIDEPAEDPNYEQVKFDVMGFILSNLGYKKVYDAEEEDATKRCKPSISSVIAKIFATFAIFGSLYGLSSLFGYKDESSSILSSILFYIFLLSIYLANVAMFALDKEKYTPQMKDIIRGCLGKKEEENKENKEEAGAGQEEAGEAAAEGQQ